MVLVVVNLVVVVLIYVDVVDFGTSVRRSSSWRSGGQLLAIIFIILFFPKDFKELSGILRD